MTTPAVIFILSFTLLFGCTAQPDGIDVQQKDSSGNITSDTNAIQRERSLDEVMSTVPIDSSYVVRDLNTGEVLSVEDRGGMLVLKRSQRVLDTFPTPAWTGGMYGHSIDCFDSTFLVFEGMYRGNSGTAVREIISVTDGRFHRSIHFTCQTHFPSGEGEDGGYFVDTKLHRNPYRITGIERFKSAGEYGWPRGRWSERFELKFDERDNIFYSMLIPLDNVPLYDRKDDEAMGHYPALVLKQGTDVYAGERWCALARAEYYAFRASGDGLDTWASGRTPKITSGSKVQGDTLYPLYD